MTMGIGRRDRVVGSVRSRADTGRSVRGAALRASPAGTGTGTYCQGTGTNRYVERTDGWWKDGPKPKSREMPQICLHSAARSLSEGAALIR
jgi:hypothetical protein